MMGIKETRTYSPDKVVLVISGMEVGGWTSITIRRTSPKFIQIKGIRGKNTRVENKDTSAEVLINVPLTSELNMVFNKVLELDETSGNGRLMVMVKDELNGETFISTNAYVTGEAERTYEGEVSDRSWVVNCMDSQWTHTGASWGLEGLLSLLKFN